MIPASTSDAEWKSGCNSGTAWPFCAARQRAYSIRTSCGLVSFIRRIMVLLLLIDHRNQLSHELLASRVHIVTGPLGVGMEEVHPPDCGAVVVDHPGLPVFPPAESGIRGRQSGARRSRARGLLLIGYRSRF